MKKIQAFLKNEDGPTAVEYAVMLAMILMGVISAIASVGVGTGGLWTNNASELTEVF